MGLTVCRRAGRGSEQPGLVPELQRGLRTRDGDLESNPFSVFLCSCVSKHRAVQHLPGPGQSQVPGQHGALPGQDDVPVLGPPGPGREVGEVSTAWTGPRGSPETACRASESNTALLGLGSRTDVRDPLVLAHGMHVMLIRPDNKPSAFSGAQRQALGKAGEGTHDKSLPGS